MEKRADRASILSKINNKARSTAITNVDKAQNYGYTADGACPSTVNCCKKNVSKATGMSKPGACASSIVEWAFRKSQHGNCSTADPRVVMPMGQLNCWIRLRKQAGQDSRADIQQTRKIALRRMKDAKARWLNVRGPMSATIATAMDLGWAPIHPNRWLNKD